VREILATSLLLVIILFIQNKIYTSLYSIERSNYDCCGFRNYSYTKTRSSVPNAICESHSCKSATQ